MEIALSSVPEFNAHGGTLVSSVVTFIMPHSLRRFDQIISANISRRKIPQLYIKLTIEGRGIE